MLNKQADIQLLSRLFERASSGQAKQLAPAINTLLQQFPADPNVLHLAAVISASEGNSEQARSLFQKAIKLNNKQPAVHNNFANLLKNLNESEAARSHYKLAVKFAPNFADAWKNLAILEFDQGNFYAAKASAERAISYSNKNSSAITLLGNIYRKQEEHQKAIDSFKTALTYNQNYMNALYGLALTHRELGEPEKALNFFTRAREISPDSPEVMYGIANALLDMHKYQDAEQTLVKLIELHPQYIDAHRTLNELHWQQQSTEKFGQSYRNAIAQFPEDQNLKIQYVENLISAKQLDKAKEIVDGSLAKGSNPNFTYLHGRISEALLNLNEAHVYYERAYRAIHNLDFAKQYFISLIKTREYKTADKEISRFIKTNQNDQLLWALQGTCWRALGDSRYSWLNNYDEFVKQYEIPSPPSYRSQSDFLKELESTLLEMHRMNQEPLNQTLRNGIQTPGRLLYKQNPVIQQLKGALQQVVEEYISHLPDDKAHPFLRRKSKSFKFSGSWSVLLKKGGYHVNHVHPEGWISSSFYVSVPDLLPAEQGSNAGSIKFGESPYQLGKIDSIERMIRPHNGLVVLFPSYTWHGTVELNESAQQYRLTTPFDVIPR